MICSDCLRATELTGVLSRRGEPYPVCARCLRKHKLGTLNATVLKGHKFDWEEGAKAAEHVVDDKGDINWKAAFFADPGIMSCPACGAWHWREGSLVRCGAPDCEHEWKP